MRIQNTENSEKENSETKQEIRTKREVNKDKIKLLHDRLQQEPYKGVLRKRCSENIQQIYRRTPMPTFCFNNVAKQLY